MADKIVAGYYRVQDELGSGGMGTVYRGIDERSGFAVAIKQLKAQIAQADNIERFRREGEALRELNHPNIVKMLDAVEEDGSHYLIMEFVSGSDLARLLEKGKLPLEKVLALAIDLADALTRAHKLNIIHRDLKPANVLIGEDDVLRLTDFGVAHVGSKARVTDTDAIVGTVDYLPPEAFDGRPFDERGDIWAFGVMLFEMLAGERPFSGDNIAAVLSAILSAPVPDLETLRPDVPVALVDLVYRMLERDPQARIRSVRQVGLELEDILRGRDTQPDRHRFDTPPIDVFHRARHNLPAQTTPFVGREHELAELDKLLNDPAVRLITIIAPGGMGKTRLALEAAENALAQFSDGVYFVELAPLSDSQSIVPAIAEATGYQFQGDDREPKQQILDFLRNKSMLLVLDNFEHLIEGAAIVTEMLQAAHDIQILATSRKRLGQTGETLFHLPGMDFPDWETPEDALEYAAVKLFRNSARRARPDFELTDDNLDYVARICRLVQGMPLGIVLAAAWLAMLTPEEIAAEIAQSFDFLESEAGHLPERQRSIRAVFDYSWNLMSDAEKEVFAKLSVFRGGFTREAAEAVAGANLRVLMSLVNKSLLRRNPESGRYEIHELLRQYGEEQLQASGALDEIHHRHSEYFLKLLHQWQPMLEGGGMQGQLNVLNTIARDMDNISTALFQAVQIQQYDLVAQALPVLWLYVMMRGLWVEFAGLFGQMADAIGQMPPTSQRNDLFALVLASQIYSCAETFQHTKAKQLVAESEQFLNSACPPHLQATLLLALGNYHGRLQNPVDARPHLQQAIALFWAGNNQTFVALSLLVLGRAYWYRLDAHEIDLSQAEKYFLEAHQLMELKGNWLGIAFCLLGLSTIASLMERYEVAKQRLQEGLVRARAIGNTLMIANINNNLGVNARNQGNYYDARVYFEEGLIVGLQSGNFSHIFIAFYNLYEILFLLGDFERAKQAINQSLGYLQEPKQSEEWATWSRAGLNALGFVAWAEGQYDKAGDYFRQVNELHILLRKTHNLCYGYNALGYTALAQHKFDEAHQYFEIALTQAQENNVQDFDVLYHLHMGWLRVETGNTISAREHLLISMKHLRQRLAEPAGNIVEMSSLLTETLHWLADVERIEKNYEATRMYLGESLRLAWRYSGASRCFVVLASWADLWVATGQLERAAGFGAFVYNDSRAFAISKERTAHLLEKLQSELSLEQYQAAIERGKSLDLETVVQELLADFGGKTSD